MLCLTYDSTASTRLILFGFSLFIGAFFAGTLFGSNQPSVVYDLADESRLNTSSPTLISISSNATSIGKLISLPSTLTSPFASSIFSH